MDVPYSQDELRKATHELIARNGLKSCYIRPLVYRGYGPMGLNPLDNPVDVVIAVWEWGAYLGEEGKARGVRAKVSSWRRIGPDSLIPQAKAGGQYLNSVLAKIESLKAGYEEAILLDEHGQRLRGHGREHLRRPRRRDRTRRRPASILDGINRRSVIQIARDLGYEVVERDVMRSELMLADEVFLSGTAAELTPVREIDDHEIGGRPARSRARSRPPSTTRCTAARSATRTWLDLVEVPSKRVKSCVARLRRAAQASPAPPSTSGFTRGHSGPALRHDPPRRDAGRGHVALGRGEGARRARARRLGVHLIEAGFPSSNPKEEALFELLAAGALRDRRDRGFGMTRRRDVAADEDPPCGCSPTLRAGLHAGRQDLARSTSRRSRRSTPRRTWR